MFARLIVTLALAAAAGALVAQVAPPVRIGGIGEEERQALEADPHYNLKVVAANGAGQYIADVDVRVVDERGARVVTARMTGPWLLAELPPGRYRVVGVYDGATQSREVVVGRDGRREVVLRWPDKPEAK
jgi:hypothetical protein